MAKVFISYSRKDSAFTDRLYKRLDQAGHDLWMDRESLKGGQKWLKEIEEHIRWADAIIVLWSADAARSEWVDKEILYAENLGKLIIPVSIDGTLPTDNMILSARQVIRAQGRFDEAVLEINAALVQVQNKATPRPDQAENTSDKDDLKEANEQGNPMKRAEIPSWRKGVSELPGWLQVVIGLAALVLAFLALFPQESRDNLLYHLGLLGPSATPTLQIAAGPTLTPSASPAPARPTPTVTDTPTATTPAAMPPSDGSVTFEAINAWWQANGYGALTINNTLQDLAVRRERQIRSRPINQLGNIELDDQGQTIEQSARVSGYMGAVVIAAYAAPRTPTLADLTDQIAAKIDAASRANYHEAGFSAYTNTVTGYTYMVLILGAGG